MNNIDKATTPIWFGVHRDGLIAVCLLDLLWMVIEFSAGATLFGLALIPFVVLLIFILSFIVVYNKQIAIGDSQAKAACIAVLLSAAAAVPFSVISWVIGFVCAVMNKLAPNTQGFKVRMPSGEHSRTGKFMQDFGRLEDQLRILVDKYDLKEKGNIYKHIEALRDKDILTASLYDQLQAVRGSRNKIAHHETVVPTVEEQRLLNRCLEDIEALARKL